MMRRGPLQQLARALAALVCSLCVSSCSGCQERRFLAELQSTQGIVERDFARAPLTWSPAETGARFGMGDGLRTGSLASATLTLRRGARLLVKSDTIMHFTRNLANPAGETDIEVATGELTVETGAVDLAVQTARGVVRLAQGSVVKVNASSDKIHFDVAVGLAEYVAQHAKMPLSATAGGGFDLILLPASVETASKGAAGAPGGAATGASAANDAGGASDSDDKPGPALAALVFQPTPPSASLTLQPGEAVVVHDPAAPTDVRMLATRCPGEAVWEFDRSDGRFDALRVRGTGELRARVPLGTFRHRVRCVRDGKLEAPLRSGRLQVVRDAAVRPLPSKPASITADADGRRYTVSYQNRLPIITLRWPDAPKAASYTLRVWPEHGTLFSIEAKQPSVTLPPERLGDGLHRFEFEAKGMRSEQGLLGVTFDYRARAAYLVSPVEGQGALSASGTARFAGGSLIGSSVSVLDVPLKLDSQGRFSADVALPVATTSTAVRVVHPTAGIHYYVRHLQPAGSP